jgi:DNA-binding response OmpR family regulator
VPDLLVLDIKMPRMTGLQVLEWLQTQHFPEMRVVVLSGSNLERDRVVATRLNADAYMIKPCDPAGLLNLIQSLVALC